MPPVPVVAVSRVIVSSTRPASLRKGVAVVPLAKDTALVKYVMRRVTAKAIGKRTAKGIVKQVLLDPVIEGVAVAIFDQRNLKSAFEFTTLQGKGEKAVARGGPFPTTDEAVDAWTNALQRGSVDVQNDKRKDGIQIHHTSRRFLGRIAKGGFTPLVPVVSGAVRRNVALNLGVPKWIIFTGSALNIL